MNLIKLTKNIEKIGYNVSYPMEILAATPTKNLTKIMITLTDTERDLNKKERVRAWVFEGKIWLDEGEYHHFLLSQEDK